MSSVMRKVTDRRRLRVVVMGAPNVGKTALISAFMAPTSVTEYKGSFEEIHSREYTEGRTDLTVEVAEIREGEAVPTVRRHAIASGDAFILVYSIDDADSFEYIYKLRDLVLEEKGTESPVPVIVVANKLDVTEERKTPIWQIADAIVTIDWEHKYAEVSASDTSQAESVFKSIISLSLSTYKEKFLASSPRRMTTPASLLSRIRRRLSVRKQTSFF